MCQTTDKALDLTGVNQQLDEAKKEVFSLKLKIYFLEDRLRQLTPEQMEKALKDHIELQVLHQNLKDELKKHKKIIQEQTRALEEVERDQVAASGRQSRAGMEAQAEIERLRKELQEERERHEDTLADRDTLLNQLEEAHARAATKDADTENLEREIEELEKVKILSVLLYVSALLCGLSAETSFNSRTPLGPGDAH